MRSWIEVILITLFFFFFVAKPALSDTYIGLGMGVQDGLNSSKDAKEYSLKVGKKLNDFFAAEIKTRTKIKDNSTSNDQRAEFAIIGSLENFYLRVGSGLKFSRDSDHGYWHAEPGVKFNLTDTWSFKTGIRFRDSFDPIYQQSDITYKFGFSKKLNDNNSISINSKFKRGDSQYNSIGVGYKYNF